VVPRSGFKSHRSPEKSSFPTPLARFDRESHGLVEIFGINFAFGVVTGIPTEFQFGTSWAEFSKTAGGVIGQTLAMEGGFSFFLESSLLGPSIAWFLFELTSLLPRNRKSDANSCRHPSVRLFFAEIVFTRTPFGPNSLAMPLL
jgi:bd-type cytochrome oxidase subunit I